MSMRFRFLPWLLFALGTLALLFAMVLGILGYGGSTQQDAGPAVTRVFMVSVGLFGAGMAVWPLLPSFGPALAAWYRQTHIGDPELPRWVTRLTPPAMVASGLFIAVMAVLSWPK